MISLQKYKSLKLESCHQGVESFPFYFHHLLNMTKTFALDACEVPPVSGLNKNKQTKKKSICQSNIAMMATASIYIQAINFILCY